MGIVTSFIPGRIRLRSRIFRDDDIASAFTSLLDATGIVTGIERNANTGSLERSAYLLPRILSDSLPPICLSWPG